MTRPKLAVYKFASCDGCQLSLLDCEDELLAVASRVHIANFPEASRAVVEGPYALTLVEGSITTPQDVALVREVRRKSTHLVSIGACATAGGIQALRNYSRVDDFVRIVYARPEYISTLETSMPISSFVDVDFELRGCPIDKRQLLEVIVSFVEGRTPRLSSHPVCMDCKMAGAACVMVARGQPCLGPVTHSGCGALCPRFNRGCFGCFGPSDTPRTEPLAARLRTLGVTRRDLEGLFQTYNAGAEPFAQEAKRHG